MSAVLLLQTNSVFSLHLNDNSAFFTLLSLGVMMAVFHTSYAFAVLRSVFA